jgi:DNA polymerase-3 subunit alpha
MNNKKDDFVHLHTHSDMSQLDGCATINSYTKVAKKRGNRAIAITDHGTMRGYYELHKATEEHGVKPIYGVEFYVAKDMNRKGLTEEEKDFIGKDFIGKDLKKTEAKLAIKEYEEKEGIRDRWHLTAWAKNDKGLKNLFYLTSISYTDGFYYKPRIDIDTLLNHSDGLMIGSGCLASVINGRYINGNKKLALKESDRLFECFNDDYWLEIQPHLIKEQEIANRFCSKLSKRYGGKVGLLATQDAHYIKQSDAVHHDVMLCIGTHKYLSDQNRFRFDGDQFFLKKRKQMKRSFEENHSFLTKDQIKEALDNTILLSEKVNAKVKVDFLAAILPEVDVGEYKSEWQYFKVLCFKGWIWRDIDRKIKTVAKIKNESESKLLSEYKNRLKYELNIIKKKNFISYFLVVHDIYKWSREQKIMCGPGRGSAAGSLVSFLLGITSVDPIEHSLLFERFMNPDRTDMPDIDMDFDKSRRQEIIEYLRQKYGNDHVVQIATVNTLKGKQCLRDVSRVLGVPVATVNQVSSSILERSDSHPRANKTVVDSFKEFEVCRNFSEKYPSVVKHAANLEGLAKTLGIHAAGVVVTPLPVWEYTPVELRKYKDKESGEKRDVVVTALDKDSVPAIGLVKLDVLGLKTLMVLRECLEEIEERHGKIIDLERIDLYDQSVLDRFTAHDFSGVFQFDTPSAEKMCEGIVFDRFADLSALNALNRPGATRSGLAKEWISKKKNPEKRKKSKFHKSIAKITSDTLGVITYQEHVNQIFIDVAGFKPSRADMLRKKIAKSKGKEAIDEIRDEFIKGAMEKHGEDSMTKEAAEKIINAIGHFGAYGFNRSHSVSYAIIAYWSMYLKTYYPLEFYWSLLKSEENIDKIRKISKDVKRRGIEILPPDVSISKKDFSIDPDKKNTIRGSLSDIKGVGEKAIETIVENQPYKSFWNFLKKIDRRKCNKSVVKALIKSGAMDRFIPNIRAIVEGFDNLWKGINDKKTVKAVLKESKKMPYYDQEERNLLASTVNPFSFGEHPIVSYKKFLDKHIKIKIAPLGGDFYDKYNNKHPFVLGIVVDSKFARIGDYHTGDLPSKQERDKQFWGSRYANVNIEGRDGEQKRIKFDIDVFERARPVLDEGPGTPVLIHCSNVNSVYSSIKSDFIINLEELRKKIKNSEEFSIYEDLVLGKHPALLYKWKSEKVKNEMITHEKFKKSRSGGIFCGVITHIKIQYDKNDNQMAFVGLFGVKKYLELVCFSSSWIKDRKKFKAGELVKIAVEKSKQRGRPTSYLYNGGGIKKIK